MIDGKELTQVDNFTYLGGIISQDGSNSQAIKQRIEKAMVAVQKLYNIWNSTNRRISTKKKTIQSTNSINTVVWWWDIDTQKRKWEPAHDLWDDMPQKIMGITRMDKVLNMQQTVINQICQKRLCYFGHIERMPATRFRKITLEGKIEGNIPWGRPPKRWSDCVETDCGQKTYVHEQRPVACSQRPTKMAGIMMRMPPLNPVLEWKA